ncbi:MAG TPA: hypothetical protein VHZ31_06515 [Solirubrobacteraceae bacterium]|nr:hypothetical protein [Solirubrobacteraceae bacterium]
MRRLPIKVHRVATEDEVEVLARLGADFVGFDSDESVFYGFDTDPRWKDERAVFEGLLPALLEPLGSGGHAARAVVELAPEQREPDAPARLAQLGVSLIQVHELRAPRDDAFVTAVAAAGAGLIVEGGFVEPTRPLDFVDLGVPGQPALAFYEADLFPTSVDPYAALVDPVEGSLGIDEIDEIAGRAPLFLHVGATPDTIEDIARRLASTRVAGLAFRLGDARLATAYAYGFEEVVAMLEVLRRIEP